jgi:hypothetical protein
MARDSALPTTTMAQPRAVAVLAGGRLGPTARRSPMGCYRVSADCAQGLIALPARMPARVQMPKPPPGAGPGPGRPARRAGPTPNQMREPGPGPVTGRTQDPGPSLVPGLTPDSGRSLVPGLTPDPGRSLVPGLTPDPGRSPAPGPTWQPGPSLALGRTQEPRPSHLPGLTRESRPSQVSGLAREPGPSHVPGPSLATGPRLVPVPTKAPCQGQVPRPTAAPRTPGSIATAAARLAVGAGPALVSMETGESSRALPPGGITGANPGPRLARTIGRMAIFMPHEEPRLIVTSQALPGHGPPTFRPRERRAWLPADTASARKAS